MFMENYKGAIVVSWLVLLAEGDALAESRGWAGAGLLGLMLFWLCFRHLPDKDKQINQLIEARDKQLGEKDKQINENFASHSRALSTVVEHCKEEARLERAIAAEHHKEQLTVLAKIHESCRESVHAIKNMENTQRMRQRLADAWQSLEAPAWSKHVDGTVTSWNQAAERVLGWKQSEVVGRSIYATVVPPERRDEEEGVLRRIANGDTIEPYATERLTKDGRRVRLTAITSPIRDQNGKVIGASTIVREVE